MSLRRFAMLALSAHVLASPLREVLSQQPPPVGHLNSNITAIAGGTIPNVSEPLKLSQSAYTGFQLLQFLEILEVYLYYEGLKNLTSGMWDTKGLPADTLEVITKTAAVSLCCQNSKR